MAEEDSNIMLKAAIIVIAIVIVILGTVFFAYPEEAGAAAEMIIKPISQAISGEAPSTTPTFILHGTEKPTPNPTVKTTISPIPTTTRKRNLWVGGVVPPDQKELDPCIKCIINNHLAEFKVGKSVPSWEIKNCVTYLPDNPEYWKSTGLWFCSNEGTFQEATVRIRATCNMCSEGLSEVLG